MPLTIPGIWKLISLPEMKNIVRTLKNGLPAASLFWPGLTTVRQQLRAMGAAACRTLLTALLEEQPERSVLEFPMELIVRQSTGPAPRTIGP